MEATQNTSTAMTTYYPPNNGASGDWTPKLFDAGDTFSRQGSPIGHFGSPVGQIPEMSALPYSSIGEPTYIYQFNVPYLGLQSTVAPAFQQIGGGTQYYFWPTIDQLLSGNFISDITPH